MLANVIFPAFAAPYVLGMFFPVAPAAALVSEAVVFRILNKHLSWWRIAAIVLVINFASTVVGVVIACLLPSGLGERGEGGPLFPVYMVLGFVVALVVSVWVEWRLLCARLHVVWVPHPFKTAAIANVTSYAVLLVVGAVSVVFFW